MNPTSLDEALHDAAAHGFVLVTVGREDSRALVGVRVWPHYYDRVVIFSDTEATAERVVIDPRPGPDEVAWCWRGDPLTAVTELLRLPKPHEPHAPRLLGTTAPAGLWRVSLRLSRRI